MVWKLFKCSKIVKCKIKCIYEIILIICLSTMCIVLNKAQSFLNKWLCVCIWDNDQVLIMYCHCPYDVVRQVQRLVRQIQRLVRQIQRMMRWIQRLLRQLLRNLSQIQCQLETQMSIRLLKPKSIRQNWVHIWNMSYVHTSYVHTSYVNNFQFIILNLDTNTNLMTQGVPRYPHLTVQNQSSSQKETASKFSTLSVFFC